jgi:hypothetical protein
MLTDYFKTMLDLCDRHQKIEEKWVEFIQIIKQMYENGSPFSSPVITRNGSRMVFILNPEKVFCQFRFNDRHGIIQFGYIEVDEYGREKDIYTDKTYFFDGFGNIGVEKNGGKPWNMSDVSDIKGRFFFLTLLETFSLISENNK